MMTGPILLTVAGLATAIVSFIAAWQWRGRYVPVHWLFFPAFGFGSLSIALMYGDIAYVEYYEMSKQYLLPILRILFGFILAVTFLLSGTVVEWKGKD